MNGTKDLICEFIMKDPKSQDLLTIVGKINESQITDFFREIPYVYLSSRSPLPSYSKRIYKRDNYIPRKKAVNSR